MKRLVHEPNQLSLKILSEHIIAMIKLCLFQEILAIIDDGIHENDGFGGTITNNQKYGIK